MSKRDADTALTGLFGAYASDDEGNSDTGEEQGAEGVLQHGDRAGSAGAASEAGSEDQPLLSSLLSPGRLPEAPSVAQLAPSASEQAMEVDLDADAEALPDALAAHPEAARLPPELAQAPPGEVDFSIKARVANLHRVKAETGKRLTAELRRMRAYKNPDFLQKMVLFHGVDDRGSAFDKSVFDPRGFPKEDYYQELAKEWDAEYQRRIAERNRGGPQFTRGAPEAAKKLPYGLSSGTSQAASVAAQAKAQALAQALADPRASKRSKWDSAPKR